MPRDPAHLSVMPSPSWHLLSHGAVTGPTGVAYERTSPQLPPISQSFVIAHIIYQHSRYVLYKASNLAALTHMSHCFHCRDNCDMLNAYAALQRHLNGLGGRLPIHFCWGCVWHCSLFVPLWNQVKAAAQSGSGVTEESSVSSRPLRRQERRPGP